MLTSASTRFFLVAGFAGLAGVGAGCGNDQFSDVAFGVMDFTPIYDAGASADPSAALPVEIAAQLGYSDGTRDKDGDGVIDDDKVEYYDFGAIPLLTALDLNTGIEVATGARVQPMYFFFDKQGNPLLSRPIREDRNGVDWIQGGAGVLNPNPHDFCEGKKGADCADPARNKKEKDRPYSIRTRDPVLDAGRGNSNVYQRPIVDLWPGDRTSSRPFYTGLWEIIEVTVPDGYVPDTIKSWTTLKAALKAGDFKARHTSKAINCPMVDERTAVTRGVSNRPDIFPRMEIWYRRKLGFCYMSEGWEALGRTLPDGTNEVYKANNDAMRLDVFDVDRIQVDQGAGFDSEDTSTKLVVPVTRAFSPIVLVANQEPGRAATVIRLRNNIISVPRPRHSEAEPPGYTPARWMWDFVVPADYTPGTFQDTKKLDPTAIRQRDNIIQGRNLPLRGAFADCGFARDPRTGFCEKRDFSGSSRKVKVTAGDKVTNSATKAVWTFAMGAFDVMTEVGKTFRVEGTADAKNAGDFTIRNINSPSEVETDPVHADETLDPTKVTAQVFDWFNDKYTLPPDPKCSGVQLECNKNSCACDSPALGYGKVCGPGIARCSEEKDAFSEFGYSCFPLGKGFCYIGCNIREPNKDAAKNGNGPDGKPLPHVDSRCKSLPDYWCLGFSVTPPEHRFCLGSFVCDPTINDPMTTQCDAFAQPLLDPMTLAPDKINIAKGQVCQDYGIPICAWPDNYEPM